MTTQLTIRIEIRCLRIETVIRLISYFCKTTPTCNILLYKIIIPCFSIDMKNYPEDFHPSPFGDINIDLPKDRIDALNTKKSPPDHPKDHWLFGYLFDRDGNVI